MKYTFFKRTIVNFSMRTIQPERGLELKNHSKCNEKIRF